MQVKTNFPKGINPQNLTLMFADDFDGKEIDFSKWQWYGGDSLAMYGEEPQTYCPKNTYLDGKGNLIFHVEYMDNTICDPESAAFVSENVAALGLMTRDSFRQKYGYFECRCKIGRAWGCNCAFWMIAGDVDNKAVCSSVEATEIDFFESWPGYRDAQGRSGKIASMFHWNHNCGTQAVPEIRYMQDGGYVTVSDHVTAAGKSVPPDFFDGAYHTYGCLWTHKGYTIYYDGYEIITTDLTPQSGVPQGNGVCHTPGFLILSNHFMNPRWPELGWSKETQDRFPFDFTVDYVRAYQLKEYTQGEACH